MIPSPPARVIVALIVACEQYGYRVEPPDSLAPEMVAELRSRAIELTNATFIECTRNFQKIGWVGSANLAFADSQSSPRDSSSALLHLLISLKLIELSLARIKQQSPAPESPGYAILLKVRLGKTVRMNFKKICKELDLEMQYRPGTKEEMTMPSVGGLYRAARHAGNSFTCQPIKQIEELRREIRFRLEDEPFLKELATGVCDAVLSLAWGLLRIVRFVFGAWYRARALRILARLARPEMIFPYAELLGGRNRIPNKYLGWKFGTTLQTAAARGARVIPFTHFYQDYHTRSFAAMRWSLDALEKLGKNPSDGAVVVNYLIPPLQLRALARQRMEKQKRKISQLAKLHAASEDNITRLAYGAFIASLQSTGAYAIELSKCYQILFSQFEPGVVLQADAVAKTARHFTTCARHRGGRTVYVADRICTPLRTSNKLIGSDGGNPHFPDRFVVFDSVSRSEFLNQAVEKSRIYPYLRSFGTLSGGRRAKLPQVLIYLQDYKDNMAAMIEIGTTIARDFPSVEVIYQEHPSFPVSGVEKLRLLNLHPERLGFLKTGDSPDPSAVLAMITGYSTAAVPGVMRGIPLIWLRRQVDNSIYGQAYLERIGIAADSTADVCDILRRLILRDGEILKTAAAATSGAKDLFEPSPAAPNLETALEAAIRDSFAEIKQDKSRTDQT